MAIINILFRCPSTIQQADVTSPLFCKQYLQIKDIVSPVIQPYYDTHAAPYIQIAKPYYDAIDRTVLIPAQAYAVKYASPRVEKAKKYGQAQWDKQMQPKIEQARATFVNHYDKKVAPHVRAATNVACPYYELAKTSALQTYHEFILPAYSIAQPHAIHACNVAYELTTKTVIPSTLWACNKTYVFLDDTVLPQLRALYAENVEPQLVRIGQRLGRYNGPPKPKHQVPDSVAASATSFFTRPLPVSASSVVQASASRSTSSSPTKTSSTIASESTEATTSPDATVSTAAVSEVSPTRTDYFVQFPPVEPNESEKRRNIRIEVTNDLIMWQDKFINAAEVGAKEIEQKVVDICERMETQEIKITGKAIVDRFVESLDQETANLRIEIMNIIETSLSSDDAVEKITAAVKKTGIELKEKAQKIRTWRERFERDLHMAINRAAHAHFEIMDNIRDLATQKLGMKWAWMDGVTYKDWKLYHSLKAEFLKWRNQLELQVVNHRSLAKATSAALDMEDLGMSHAKDAALTLKNLKEAGLLKALVGDASNNFDLDQLRVAVDATNLNQDTQTQLLDMPQFVPKESESAGQVSDKESTGVILEQTAVEESTDKTLWNDRQAAIEKGDTSMLWKDSVSSTDEEASFATQVESDDRSTVADSEADNYHSQSESPIESDTSTSSNSIENINTVIMNANSDEQTVVMNPSDNQDEEPQSPVKSVAKEELKEELDTDGQSPALEVEAKEGEEPTATLSEVNSVKPAMFGAAAQVVPGRKGPIFDDEDEADITARATARVKDAYSTASSLASLQYSIAMSIISSQIGTATPKPIHEQMMASAASAYSNMLETASSAFQMALDTATQRTPMPTPTVNVIIEKWASVESIAKMALQTKRIEASQQFEISKIAAMATPVQSNAESLMQKASYAYYAGLGIAQARYEEFLSSAGDVLRSLTATPTPTDLQGTASSMALDASNSAVSAASVASNSAASAVSVASDSAASVASVAGESIESFASAAKESAASFESAALSAGGALFSVFDETVSKVSAQIFQEPTPTVWYEAFLSSASCVIDTATSAASGATTDATQVAQVKWDDINALVSELIVGKEPPFTESVFNRLSSAYGKATEMAGSFASEATSSASSIYSDASETVSNVVSEAADRVKSVKDEL